ncbi:MAG: 2OG-Fe dioxygenase family protein [Myxococcales bacterium]|nr:2OG-Fe dioxygenase family protein [Myxococcales bacterium]MBL0192728.1 2OG-Fe dioxygenase family protein [Myxococcales bacterium]HQY60080.1 2OG-Fe dioxygenase family protein [Polyangiaceae bacterium]
MPPPLELHAPRSRPAALASLRDVGFAVVAPDALAGVAELPRDSFVGLERSWASLPPDPHLLDGGAYRFRRHGCFVQQLVGASDLSSTPPRPHYQPVTYNALHGGIVRWFAPLESTLAEAPGFVRLVAGLGRAFADARADVRPTRWHVEAHAFRIDPREGVGRPTPEGAHRDGVDFVAVVLVDRRGVRGGETRVFDAAGPHGVRFSLVAPWSALLLDDARVVHETTPIVLEEPGGHRDTLVLTYREAGFQEP